jgi:RNA polymerase sigma-70 factor, ECF subfamily
MASALDDEVRRLSEAGDATGAVTAAITGLGPELLGFLHVLVRDPADAGEVFADLCVRIWRSLPGFRWESSVRTWAYVLARRAFYDHRDQRAAWRQRHTGLTSDDAVDALIARLRTQGTTQLREEQLGRIARLRAQLDPDDQAVLTLRVDRGLEWSEIARVLAEEGDALDDAALARAAASLRKRFERLKATLRRMAAENPGS